MFCNAAKLFLRPDDTNIQIFRKSVIFYGGVTSFCIHLSFLLYYLSSTGLLSAPAMITIAPVVASLIMEKRLNYALLEVALYGSTVSNILHDWRGAMIMRDRVWPVQVLIVDVALVCRMHPRVTFFLVTPVCTWLLLSGTETAYRWGLYSVDFGRSTTCDCASPPCPLGLPLSISVIATNVSVFLFDFYFTRGFASGLQKEHEKMEAAIHATERIASSLSHFDLTSAEAVLSTSTLPEPLHDALKQILTNLEIYRPYLPDALFAEMHTDISRSRSTDGCVPGLTTKKAALVFTDIQGSTATWEACPDGMHDALQVHNAVIRICLGAHSGYEVKTIGDAFMVAFEHASDAVQFSLLVQERLVSAVWPSKLLEIDYLQWDDSGPWCGLRVRVGVHCGEVDVQVNPLTGRYDYFGNTVNKAARMEGACVGGAVAVTQEVLDEAGDLSDVCVIDMGAVELKGVTGGVPAYLLLPESLEGRKEYVEGQMKLKREDRRQCWDVERSSSDNSTKSTSMRGPELLQLQHRASVTVGVIEAAVDRHGNEADITENLNGVLNKVVTSTERTRGTVVSLQGSRVAVGWNAVNTCATHVESSLAFVRIVGWRGETRDLHVGLGTEGWCAGLWGAGGRNSWRCLGWRWR